METTINKEAIPDWPRGITFEQVWAGFQELKIYLKELATKSAESNDDLKKRIEEVAEKVKETAEQQKKTDEQMKKTDEQLKENAEQQKETDKQIKETDKQMKETDKQMKKTAEQMKKTAEQMKKTDEQMGGLHNRFGELAEHLVAPGIHERFNKLGYHFGALFPRGVIVKGEDGRVEAEIDLLLENDNTIMAVEIKATVKVNDIEVHTKRLEILRDYRQKFNEPRKIEGAIAGAIFGIEEKKAAIEAGFYVIVQTGDTMKIEVPEGFTPRRF